MDTLEEEKAEGEEGADESAVASDESVEISSEEDAG